MSEKIVHAAVKTTGAFICIGKSHADCFYQGKNLGFKMSKKSEDQGFMTNKGRYVNRKIAARIAKRAKQLDPNDKSRKVTYLFSEDIWFQRERFIYCPIRGYTEVKND